MKKTLPEEIDPQIDELLALRASGLLDADGRAELIILLEQRGPRGYTCPVFWARFWVDGGRIRAEDLDP